MLKWAPGKYLKDNLYADGTSSVPVGFLIEPCSEEEYPYVGKKGFLLSWFSLKSKATIEMVSSVTYIGIFSSISKAKIVANLIDKG